MILRCCLFGSYFNISNKFWIFSEKKLFRMCFWKVFSFFFFFLSFFFFVFFIFYLRIAGKYINGCGLILRSKYSSKAVYKIEKLFCFLFYRLLFQVRHYFSVLNIEFWYTDTCAMLLLAVFVNRIKFIYAIAQETNWEMMDSPVSHAGRTNWHLC